MVAADLAAEHGKGGSAAAAGVTAPHASAEHTFRVGDLAAAPTVAQRKLRTLINRDDALKTRVAVLGGFREAVPVEAEIERVTRFYSQDLRPLRVARKIDIGGVVGIIRDRVHAVPCRPRHSGAFARMVADVGVRRAADGVGFMSKRQNQRQVCSRLNTIIRQRFAVIQIRSGVHQLYLLHRVADLVHKLLFHRKDRVRRTDGQRMLHMQKRFCRDRKGRLRGGIVHRPDRLRLLLNGRRFGLLPDHGRFGLLRRVLRQCRRRQQRQAKRQDQQPAQQSFFHSTLLKFPRRRQVVILAGARSCEPGTSPAVSSAILSPLL